MDFSYENFRLINMKEYSRRLMSASSFQASSWRDRVEEFYPNL